MVWFSTDMRKCYLAAVVVSDFSFFMSLPSSLTPSCRKSSCISRVDVLNCPLDLITRYTCDFTTHSSFIVRKRTFRVPVCISQSRLVNCLLVAQRAEYTSFKLARPAKHSRVRSQKQKKAIFRITERERRGKWHKEQVLRKVACVNGSKRDS